MSKKRRSLHYTLLMAFCILFLLQDMASVAEADETPRYRALLVACDEFVGETDMTPIGENNLRIMETMLAQDTRGFEVTRQYGITSSRGALGYAISWAFEGAKEGDVSLLYISTHGDFDTTHNNPSGHLLLSDGALEDRVTALELNEMFDKIPGTKVLLVDACNSGALIGKGVSPSIGAARVPRTFQNSEYKVLTSSGASEPSWYLQSALEFAPPGSSNFTTALAVGAGLIGGYAADANRDGTITLSEMYEHLWINQASSAVQMYPQDDDFPLFVYDKESLNEDIHGELTGFMFGAPALDAKKPVLKFGYTATVDTRVAYRITYLRDGQWDWVHGETLRDVTEFDGDADPLGNVSPGRKEIELDLTEVLPPDWTYGMIHIMTIGDSSAGKQPFIYASRVFSAVQPPNTDPEIALRAPGKWTLKTGREMEIFVAHTVPCNLSVSILDEGGNVVRRLVTSRPTRPQGLSPDGSLLYWNGLDAQGEPVAPGQYTIEATARVGGNEHETWKDITIQ